MIRLVSALFTPLLAACFVAVAYLLGLSRFLRETASTVTFDNVGVLLAVGLGAAVVAGLGAVLAYNTGVLVQRLVRPRPLLMETGVVASRGLVETNGSGGPLARFQRIGLVLAGGGAKGAYQAGAMLALHEFLRRHDALWKVRMVSGSSIGAWNALFWMTDLIERPSPNRASVHELWWRSISLSRLIELDWFVPFVSRHIANASPWREWFRQLFAHTPDVRARLERLLPGERKSLSHGATLQPLHFYLTRYNATHAALEFTTNWFGVYDLMRRGNQPVVPPEYCHVVGGGSGEAALRELEDVVFASMSIPPVFAPARGLSTHGADELYEDGGIADNIPLSFAPSIENCDLVFVLALGAPPEGNRKRMSVIRKLMSLAESWQRRIEADVFKSAALYNAAAHGQGLPQMSVVAIAPGEPLALNTLELWRPDKAAKAFEFMYDATRRDLEDTFNTDRGHLVQLAIATPDRGLRHVYF